jgi:HAD superfamily hydrolase (TIGR01509 family)
VLFDMDGTVIDSEPYWISAEQELVTTHGGVWTEADGRKLVGKSLVDSAKILQDAGADLPVDEILDFLLDRVVAQVKVRIPWRPGALALFEQLHAAHIPYALVTASYRRFAEIVAEAGQFTVMVPGDEVTNGKPHPESYLLAAQKLGVDISKCVAMEDSLPGVASAMASGAQTIGIPCMLPIPAQAGLSRAHSLEQLNVEVLAVIASGQQIDFLGAPEVGHEHGVGMKNDD